MSEVSFIWTSWKRQKIIDFLASSAGVGPLAISASGEPGNDQSNSPGKERPNIMPTSAPSAGPRLRMYNKMEQNKQLTNKKGIFVNMREYYRSIG